MDYYLWVKAAHIISVISWMAGLLYLPRLFVYHSESEVRSHQSETFKIMERRLLKAIMTPAMVLSWFFGLVLAFGVVGPGAFDQHWFLFKFIAVVLLTICHFILARYQKEFSKDSNNKTARFYRILNEVPTVLMIVIVVLVVVKPF